MVFYYGEPWQETTLVMRCDYCGTHGREFKCVNCGAPVGPRRTMHRVGREGRIEVTSHADSSPRYLGPPVMGSESVFTGDDWGR